MIIEWQLSIPLLVFEASLVDRIYSKSSWSASTQISMFTPKLLNNINSHLKQVPWLVLWLLTMEKRAVPASWDWFQRKGHYIHPFEWPKISRTTGASSTSAASIANGNPLDTLPVSLLAVNCMNITDLTNSLPSIYSWHQLLAANLLSPEAKDVAKSDRNIDPTTWLNFTFRRGKLISTLLFLTEHSLCLHCHAVRFDDESPTTT